ncbi:MAG: hypothetical protein K8T10_08300 [Candidatus Eremiobacteraeota bacterium]|nr:hypothetical protein [Candidatus Eremiobacteraeota bacterium]
MDINWNGKCMFCGRIINKRGMKKHLKTCKSRIELIDSKDDKSEKFFCISAQDYFLPEFWLLLSIPVNSTLEELDMFLYNIWLINCGDHPSQFIIQGIKYVDMACCIYFMMEHCMDAKLNEVLKVADEFVYENTYGSNVRFELKVMFEYSGKKGKEKASLMARNIAPDIRCYKCDKKATIISPESLYSSFHYMCEECADESGGDMLLPLVNSPVIGI